MNPLPLSTFHLLPTFALRSLKMKFVDEAKIHVKAGDGGTGCVSFRRERFVPRGGPDGGDGGKGGDVILQADGQLSTLLDLTYPQQLRARSGTHGKGKGKTGRDGEDRIIRVPVGTIIRDDQTGEVLQDLVTEGQEFVAAKAGRGGRGNARFATSTHRAPRRADKGEKGEERWLRLELKLLADIGLVGYPNVGKSSLLSRISSAKPKIADYPFTTLSPNLGVVGREDHRPFVVADIPGLIERASQGAGLGLTFLRHVERTRLLVHLLDLSKDPLRSPIDDFNTLNRELRAFQPSLQEKPQIVAMNKIDLAVARERATEFKQQFEEMGYRVYMISAMTGEGIEELVEAVCRKLDFIDRDS